jgi:peptidoglycan/xylan/chitin deacetylase (PgdA/CDA1 family)
MGRLLCEVDTRTHSGVAASFAAIKLLGLSSWLRCIVFHDISAFESPFTKGMGVTINPSSFEAALKFVTRYYTPVSLQDVLDHSSGKGLPSRPVLVTFDDGYASAAEWAMRLCTKFDIPAVFFLNAAFLDNRRLAPDNLVCYVVNELGIGPINAAMRIVKRVDISKLESLSEVFSRFFPVISLVERDLFLHTLAQLAGVNEQRVAAEAGLYLTGENLCKLVSSGFEVGNHTYTHARCRSLSQPEIGEEIDRNKVELEALTGKRVRSFSVPYGSFADLTKGVLRYCEDSGHEVIFLSESVANRKRYEPLKLNRVSIHGETDDALFVEVEVLPRLRAIRNKFISKRNYN